MDYVIGSTVGALAGIAILALWRWRVVSRANTTLAIINGNLSILLESERSNNEALRAAMQRKLEAKHLRVVR